MKKSKKKVAPKKKAAPKKVEVELKKESKPTEVKAVPSFIEIPYVPRKIDRVPPPKTK
tara:strand:- start:1840 stop:2013 length:174 start_codon:yes stop_codon:yes gene_type:complete